MGLLGNFIQEIPRWACRRKGTRSRHFLAEYLHAGGQASFSSFRVWNLCENNPTHFQMGSKMNSLNT